MTPKNRALRVYLAGPLFSDAERSYNAFLKHLLDDHCEVYLPQADGFLMSELVASGQSPESASATVFRNDIAAIEKCDVLLIVLDGRAVDEGAALELGYAFAREKICVSLQTDFRRLAPFGNNPMISGAVTHAFHTTDRLIEWTRAYNAEFSESARA